CSPRGGLRAGRSASPDWALLRIRRSWRGRSRARRRGARPRRGGRWRSSVGAWTSVPCLGPQEVHDEHERFVRGDRGGRAFGAVGEFGGDDQFAPSADLHPGHPLFPAGDHLTLAEREGEWFVPFPGGVGHPCTVTPAP